MDGEIGDVGQFCGDGGCLCDLVMLMGFVISWKDFPRWKDR